MWNKVIPIAAVLILGWIGLNLLTEKDADDHSAETTTAESTETAAETTEQAEATETESASDTETASESASDSETASETATTSESESDSGAAATAAVAAGAAAVTAVAAADSASDDAASTEEAAPAEEAASVDSGDATGDATEQASAEETAEPSTDADTAADENTSSEASEQATSSGEAASTEESTQINADGSRTEMRYPTDPVTGMTIYDGGKVEVTIPAPEPEPVAPEPVAPVEEEQPAEESAPEPVAVEPETEAEDAEPVSQVGRYPFDPVTGLSIYENGVITEESESGVQASSEAASQINADGSRTEMRYPIDPVTGATLYDQGKVEVTIAAPEPEPEPETEATESAVTTEAAQSDSDGSRTEMRYPIDPVTGATLYDQGKVEVTIAAPEAVAPDSDADTDEEQPAEQLEAAPVPEKPEPQDENQEPVSQVGRFPVDPVTGATVYDNGVITEDEAATDSLPTDPVTGATIYAESSEQSAGQDAGGTVTLEQRGSFDLGGMSRQLGLAIGTTSVALEKATDADSAKASLPLLESAESGVLEVTEQMQTMPDSAKEPLKKVIDDGMAGLKPLADTALTRSGVGPVIGPALDSLMNSFNALVE